MCMDGRDTPPTSGAGYMEKLEAKLAEIGHGESRRSRGSTMMDRDKRWERVQKAYDVMCRAPGACESVAAGGVKAVIEGMYAKEGKDEFIEPTGLLADGGIADGDVFVCFNFRADRAREMFECMSVAPKFETAVARKPAVCVQMTGFYAAFVSPFVFPPNPMMNGLGVIVSSAASRSSASPRPKSARRAHARAPAAARPRPAPSPPPLPLTPCSPPAGTRTSPSSSTAGARSRSRARSAS